MKDLFTAQHIFSVIFVLLSVLQYRNARHHKKVMMKQGTSGPATFGASMIVGNYVVVIILIIVAISLWVGPLSH